MRWLHNIPFSSTPSSSASSPSTADEPFSPPKRYSTRTNPRGATIGWRFGAIGPRLTRQKKLRHLKEHEMTRPSSSSKSDSVDNVVLSRSPSSSSSVITQSSRLSTLVPVPLPLPLPLPDNSNSGEGNLRFPSPKERESIRERVDGAGEGVSSSLSPISRYI